MQKNEPEFGLEEWNDTVSYLLDQPCRFKSIEQAKAYLIVHLGEEKIKTHDKLHRHVFFYQTSSFGTN